MRIIECYIENFGKLSDFKFKFDSGLNTIKADNGYGKTTLSVFIKAMFYGLDDTKKTKLEENDRKHYLPWNGGRCGGWLRLICDKGEYRIERSFAQKASDDTFKLYDMNTGLESDALSENIGEELFGIDSDGFERTIFLSEQNLSGKNENKTVSAKLSNLVGYEGDLSVMDEAIQLLEKERKIYHKRGGTGEIGELKERITTLDLRLTELKRRKLMLADEELNLSRINEELKVLYEERKRLRDNESKALEHQKRLSNEKQYRDIKKSLDEEKELKRAEDIFFNGNIPTRDELESKRKSLLEAKRLSSIKLSEEKGEFDNLSILFKNAPKDEEFEKARELLILERDKRREAEIIRQEALRISVPKENENISKDIDNLIEKAKAIKNVNKSYHFTLPIGIIAIAIGIALSFVLLPLLAISAIGVLLAFFAIANIFSNKKVNEEKEGLYRVAKNVSDKTVYCKNTEELLDLLYSLRANIQSNLKEASKKEELMKKSELLFIEADKTKAEIQCFLNLFAKTDLTLDELLDKNRTYKAMLKAHNDELLRFEEIQRKAKACENIANDFISRFNTFTDEPFDEITRHLIQYETISHSIKRIERSLSDFAALYSIDPENMLNPDEAILNYTDSTELNLKISALEKDKTIIERNILMISEECDAIDECASEIEELNERLEGYKFHLNVIIKTKEFLTEAKDSLTAKYLFKTKSAFNKYVSLIGQECGDDFKMDTSFGIMKSEHSSFKQTAAFSRGTRDLYALAARFALIDSLYENESPFIILDDPFAYFDDTKLKAAISSIKEIAENKQIIYLTCSDARSI